jgi:hypothetical protein
LPEATSELYFGLLNEWLRVCDGSHEHVNSFVSLLPTRVLDVGSSEDSTTLRIYDTKRFAKGRYLALSHCWGHNMEHFSTTKANINIRCKELDFNMLPKTFQDAIIVTRKVHVQFLWIDSLCIIQDDMDDWASESVRMEEVFAQAYCTIASTSTTDSDGFLYRSPRHFTKLGDGSLLAYASKRGADFDRDVEHGGLNQRGWVLQERALSRRILYFTESQTYWECGSAIWCETNEPIR